MGERPDQAPGFGGQRAGPGLSPTERMEVTNAKVTTGATAEQEAGIILQAVCFPLFS